MQLPPPPLAYMHRRPDLDCLVAGWLLDRFYPWPDGRPEWRYVGFADELAGDAFRRAAAVVDIGGELSGEDPRRLRFDHHQLPDPRATCAATLVMQHLIRDQPDLLPLMPLVSLTAAGDAGDLLTRGYGLSSSLGLHALVSSAADRAYHLATLAFDAACQAGSATLDDEASYLDAADEEIRTTVWGVLDLLARRLRQRAAARAESRAKIVSLSFDERVVAVDPAVPGTVAGMLDGGSQVAIGAYALRLPRTFAMELWLAPACPLTGPELMDRLRLARAVAQDFDAVAGLASFHVERRFMVRGTAKGPRRDPLPFTAADLAAWVEAALAETPAPPARLSG